MTRYVLLKIEDDEQAETFLRDSAAALINDYRNGGMQLLTPTQENYVGYSVVSVLREGHPDFIGQEIERTYQRVHELEAEERTEVDRLAQLEAERDARLRAEQDATWDGLRARATADAEAHR